MANAGASWSHSPIPQAQALFDQGVVSYREGLRQERELWRRAVEIDPSFGGALLRIWMLDQVFNVDGDFPGGAPERESEDRNRLLPLVEDLGARDAALYRAIANADAGARSYTLGAYLEQYPDDDLAWMLVNDGTPATAKRILAARPTLPAARVLVAHGQVTPGDASEAVRTLDACLADTPQAVVCLYWRSLDLDEGGQCGRAELDAQSLLRLEPGNQWAHTLSAGLLASRGAPIDAVVEALRDPSRTGSGADTGGADEVTSYRGDFRSVSLLVREAASRVNPRAPDEVHFLQIWPALRAMTESGDLAGAGKIADDYLARRAAWPQPCPSCEAIAYAASVRAGHASRADLDAHLRADLEALNPPGPFRPQAWAMTYARATMTTSEAVAAVRKLDEVGAPDAWVFYPADVARTLALAGRFEAARPLLEESVRPCSAALRQPFDWAQAHLYLGEADEHDGTPTSACGHYAKVIGLWGHATPRSVTADEARAHAARLGCKI
jgi:tetratricopeptide (TPR) repeat protein